MENIFGLPYDNTEWGLFYQIYKSKNQLQIQKYLEKVGNMLMKKRGIPEKRKFVKSIFYETDYDMATQKKMTPQIILKEKTRGYSDTTWMKKHLKQTEILDSVYTKLIHRMTLEYAEVVAFYQEQKDYLELVQKQHRLDHAKMNIECPHCNASISRTNLSKHKKTNKKCLEIQERMTNL